MLDGESRNERDTNKRGTNKQEVCAAFAAVTVPTHLVWSTSPGVRRVALLPARPIIGSGLVGVHVTSFVATLLEAAALR